MKIKEKKNIVEKNQKKKHFAMQRLYIFYLNHYIDNKLINGNHNKEDFIIK